MSLYKKLDSPREAEVLRTASSRIPEQQMMMLCELRLPQIPPPLPPQ